MKKTMYFAMNNLANFISKYENYNSEEIWNKWSELYKPLNETIPNLKELCEMLCKIDKEEIYSVPEKKYRETIQNVLRPIIDKEEV